MTSKDESIPVIDVSRISSSKDDLREEIKKNSVHNFYEEEEEVQEEQFQDFQKEEVEASWETFEEELSRKTKEALEKVAA